MTPDLVSLRDFFRSSLLDDTLPFWIRNAIDRQCGGYMFSVDRIGEVIDTDKSIWAQGRFAWLLSTLYLKIRANSDWIHFAETGIKFLMENGFDGDGRMFFHVARNGAPIRKRRYYFSETFTIIGFAAYAKATHDVSLATRTRRLFTKVLAYYSGSLALPEKFTNNRKTLSLANPMILLATSQVLRDTIGYPDIECIIDNLIGDIEAKFLKPEEEVLMETVGANGEILDHFDGRLLNPGHAIEAAWFILHEARHRNGDARLINMGTRILDWMWNRGWDTECGGCTIFGTSGTCPCRNIGTT
jgi:N-acylglucosamine 2-epimerase